MDGEPLKGASGLTFRVGVMEATAITVEFANVTIEVEADAEVDGLVETTEFGSEHRTYRRIDIDDPASQ